MTGGRDFDIYSWVRNALWPYRESAVVVHGAATGADSLAAHAALELGMTAEAFPAQWRAYGKAAGAIRNQEMLDSGIDLVLAFPGGRGTGDMVARAHKAGVPVRQIRFERVIPHQPPGQQPF